MGEDITVVYAHEGEVVPQLCPADEGGGVGKDNVGEMEEPWDVPTSGLMPWEVNLLNRRQTDRSLRSKTYPHISGGEPRERTRLTGERG